MRLIRSHGLGNDYLVLAHDHPMRAETARALCHRHTGVGGDGVLEHVATDSADYGLRIWNPDGSLAEKSGNGLRIFARYLVDHCYAPLEFTIEVPAGVVRCEVDGETGLVTVEMGTATLEPAEVPCRVALLETPVDVCGTSLRLTAVGMGNPHCVVFVDELLAADASLDSLPWRDWGAALEVHPHFPNRTNVQFVRVIDGGRIELRVWERGAGPTLASGSSACAAAVAALQTGRTGGALAVQMPGGVLQVTVSPELAVTQTGPVEEICVVQSTRRWP
jgi:diaminopimelate epimerase